MHRLCRWLKCRWTKRHYVRFGGHLYVEYRCRICGTGTKGYRVAIPPPDINCRCETAGKEEP